MFLVYECYIAVGSHVDENDKTLNEEYGNDENDTKLNEEYAAKHKSQ